jgi:hypothetical protein
MSAQSRSSWPRHIDQVIRSQHYSWLGEGLAGAPPNEALGQVLTDIMHICRREGISFDTLLAASRTQFEDEENQVSSDGAGTRNESGATA